MELKRYFLPLKRWWWLLVAATIVAALSSFLATIRQDPIYQSITTLMIGQVITDPNPTTAEFNLSQQLAENYAEIANREPVRYATMQALGLNWLPDYNAAALPNGQFIEIVVTDTVPERAQAVANELANQLILRSPTAGGSNEQERQAFITKQLDNLQTQITSTEEEIAKLREELGGMDSARQISDTQFQITALEAKLTDLQANYANLLSNTQSGALNSISVIEAAGLPRRPIGPNKLLTVLLSAAIGLSLAVAAAYLLDYMDDTIKSPEEIESLTHLPILGYISELDIEGVGQLYVAENPRHPIVEDYRNLRTNLEFAGVDQPLKTLFITSAEVEDGKSSVSANLAVVIAQAEKKVILLDADLRRPNIHNFFGLPNDYGLSDVFRGRIEVTDAIKEWSNGKVLVITAGTPPPNPAELLGSNRMIQILDELKKLADIVVVDGPPFVVTDAAVLASKVDGVVLVVRAAHTHIPSVRAMMDQLQRSGARVLGVVLNRIPAKSMSYYTGNRYYQAYYTEDSGGSIKDKHSNRKQKSSPFGWKSNKAMQTNNKRR